jgi:predicted GIY-YIG superfamily endonuclease
MGIWHVYMVRCRNNALYAGVALNVQHRVAQHNSGKGSRAVVMMGLPAEIVYVEAIGLHGDALKREIEIKNLSKLEKEKLVAACSQVRLRQSADNR